jgi:hypothetical protein
LAEFPGPSGLYDASLELEQRELGFRIVSARL